jgi:hypothetical protein
MYKHVSSISGAVFSKDFPARGLSVGDYDNDGDLDVLIINNGDAPALLRNEGGNRNNWVGLNLVATRSKFLASARRQKSTASRSNGPAAESIN